MTWFGQSLLKRVRGGGGGFGSGGNCGLVNHRDARSGSHCRRIIRRQPIEESEVTDRDSLNHFR